jgi:hypothetical protein
LHLDDPISLAFKATGDPDTMYMNEALKQPDAHEFRKAMVKEVVDHTNNKHWEVMEKTDLSTGFKLLPAVWAMRRKRQIVTQEVDKWKSRLNLGGHVIRCSPEFTTCREKRMRLRCHGRQFDCF